MTKINFGCANHYRDGWLNVDLNNECGKIDKALDMNIFPYDIESFSVSDIYISHTLEHLEEPEKVMEEFFRIVEDGGRINIISPYREQYGTVHRWSFDLAYFLSYTEKLKPLFGKPKSRSLNWHWARVGFHDVKFKFRFTRGYWKYILGLGYLMEWVVNSSFVVQRLYEFFLSHIIKPDELEILYIK